MGLGTLPSSSTPGDRWPCCDAGAPADGCTCKEVVQQVATVRFGEHNAELQPRVFVYVLDAHSHPMRKECYQDCKIKHAKVRKCQEVNFPTRLRICIMIQSLITQLHTVFPQNSCFPLCTGRQRVFEWEAIQYCVVCLLLLMTLFRPRSEGGITDGLTVLFCFLAHLHHSTSGQCFMNTLCSGPVRSWMLCWPHSWTWNTGTLSVSLGLAALPKCFRFPYLH